MYRTIHSLYRKLPPAWRTALKRNLNTDGHGRGRFDWLTAGKDAVGKKRLDHALEGLIETIGSDTARGLAGKVCVDFGAGYVPSDGVALWVMGASSVYGVDYNDIAMPREIARAVRRADGERVISLLESLQLDSDWQGRLDVLQGWARDHRGGFPPGYTYVAPADVIASPELLPNFDILVSTSVLEHIQPSRMSDLLDSLSSRQRPGAMQFHRVDLRDHRDFENNPYGFLDPSCPFDAENEADARGNGMTLVDWEDFLEAHQVWGLCVTDYQPGRRQLVPPGVSPARLRSLADSLVLQTGRK